VQSEKRVDINIEDQEEKRLMAKNDVGYWSRGKAPGLAPIRWRDCKVWMSASGARTGRSVDRCDGRFWPEAEFGQACDLSSHRQAA
jgi:hypothetical protein